VPYGPRTIFTLEARVTSDAGPTDVVARGSTCPLNFLAPGTGGPSQASLLFAPAPSFSATASDPVLVRSAPLVTTLASGDILVTGGLANGTATAASETFVVSSSRFISDAATLSTPRAAAQINDIPNVGALVTGGYDDTGAALASAEVFRTDTREFTSFATGLGGRIGHQAVLVREDTVLITGGAASKGGTALNTTATIRVQLDGNAPQAGLPMKYPRRDHAAVLASGVPVMIGGYDDSGVPQNSIEVGVPNGPDFVFEVAKATLTTPRAEATATLLNDGTIPSSAGSATPAERRWRVGTWSTPSASRRRSSCGRAARDGTTPPPSSPTVACSSSAASEPTAPPSPTTSSSTPVSGSSPSARSSPRAQVTARCRSATGPCW
jgi:hypothetical protein